MIKNTTEAVSFAAGRLFKMEFSKELLEKNDTITKLITASGGKMTKEVEKARQELINLYTPEQKEILESVGAKTHIDTVILNMTMGEFFFSIYVTDLEEPVAPLQKAIFNKKLQDLAVSLTKEEFELPTEVKDRVMKMMDNDELWKRVQFHVYANVPVDKKEVVKKYTLLNYVGVQYFSKIIGDSVAALTLSESA